MADRYKFQCGKYADGDLRVLSFRGTEGVSRLFRYEIELTSPGADIDLDSMVGQRARLLIGSIESRRYVNGIIERFEQGGSGGAADETIYCATLVPTVAPLGLITNCRVFQEVSTIEIVKQVFAQAKLPSEALRIGVRESSYKPRDYCVQYQETDLAFICRLLEEEGIAFFFEHSERKDVMAIVDAPAGWKGVPGADNLVYRHHHDSALAPEGVTVLNASSSMYAGKALLRDYRFVHPDLSDMEVTASGSAFSQYQRYFYPGEYVEPALGTQLAKVRHEEQQCRKNCFRGRSNVRALCPDFAALAHLPKQGVIVTAPGDHADFVSRYFAPAAGIDEDPVTGSAHTTLTPYWAERLGRTSLSAIQASERRGFLQCTLHGDRVLISGQGVLYLEGKIRTNENF